MDTFTEAVTRLETLLTKQEDDSEDDKKEPPKDEEDNEEKAKKALDTLKSLGYNVDTLRKGSVDRPESTSVQKSGRREPPEGARITSGFIDEFLKQTEGM